MAAAVAYSPQLLLPPPPYLLRASSRSLAVEALAQVAKEGLSIDDGAIAARSAALSALGRAAQEGNRAALEVLVAGAKDWHPKVKDAAVQALAQVVQKGDRKAVHARLQGAQALAPLALSGDARAVEALAAALNDEHASIREAAMGALIRVAEEGESTAGPLVAARVAALEALRPAALQGDKRAVQALVRCAKDWHIEVREAGIEAVAALAELEAGLGCHAVVVAKVMAIQALAPAARAGEARAVRALAAAASAASGGVLQPMPPSSPRGGRAREAVRAFAVEALAHVVLDGDSASSSVVSARVGAVEALCKASASATASGGFDMAQRAVGILAKCSSDWQVEVRTAAIAALAEVATRGAAPDGAPQEVAAAMAAAHWAAIAALVPAARTGNAQALAVLTSQDVGGSGAAAS
mmetsp:Transcript_53259/g.152656  ORF Transcript_53259/g.152656 Transcript_53259/m.152656 type:complete len:412 (-) Transcript_53259:89-1324(-)